jgi:hypothetical protein
VGASALHVQEGSVESGQSIHRSIFADLGVSSIGDCELELGLLLLRLLVVVPTGKAGETHPK